MLTAPVAPERATNFKTSLRANSSRFPLSITGNVGRLGVSLDMAGLSDRGGHGVERRRVAGPGLERKRCLLDQHAQAVVRAGAPIPRDADQSGRLGVIDEIHD